MTVPSHGCLGDSCKISQRVIGQRLIDCGSTWKANGTDFVTPWIAFVRLHCCQTPLPNSLLLKLPKLYWPSRSRSPKRLFVLLEPKIFKARPKKYPALLAPEQYPLPAPLAVPPWPIIYSFRRHCTGVPRGRGFGAGYNHPIEFSEFFNCLNKSTV